MNNSGTHPVLGVWDILWDSHPHSVTGLLWGLVHASWMYFQELQMCSNKAHMARNSKNYCRCNVFFRPLRQINLEINKCHVEAFPLLWSKNRVFYCLIKPTGLLFPSSTHHHTQFSWKGTEPGRPHFPLSLFPSLAPRACYYGVGFARRVLSWEGPLLKLNFWSMVSMMTNGMAEHLYQGWKH